MPCISSLLGDAILKEYRQLGIDDAPVLPPPRPFFRDIYHGQIKHFQETFVRRENRFCLGHFSELAFEALNGISGIDQSPNLLRILEILGDHDGKGSLSCLCQTDLVFLGGIIDIRLSVLVEDAEFLIDFGQLFRQDAEILGYFLSQCSAKVSRASIAADSSTAA